MTPVFQQVRWAQNIVDAIKENSSNSGLLQQLIFLILVVKI